MCNAPQQPPAESTGNICLSRKCSTHGIILNGAHTSNEIYIDGKKKRCQPFDFNDATRCTLVLFWYTIQTHGIDRLNGELYMRRVCGARSRVSYPPTEQRNRRPGWQMNMFSLAPLSLSPLRLFFPCRNTRCRFLHTNIFAIQMAD